MLEYSYLFEVYCINDEKDLEKKDIRNLMSSSSIIYEKNINKFGKEDILEFLRQNS
jgi:hypothetical protein